MERSEVSISRNLSMAPSRRQEQLRLNLKALVRWVTFGHGFCTGFFLCLAVALTIKEIVSESWKLAVLACVLCSLVVVAASWSYRRIFGCIRTLNNIVDLNER